MQGRATALARRLDDPDRSQAVDRPLGKRQAATEKRRQLLCAERTRWKRWQQSSGIVTFRPIATNAPEMLLHVAGARLSTVRSGLTGWAATLTTHVAALNRLLASKNPRSQPI